MRYSRILLVGAAGLSALALAACGSTPTASPTDDDDGPVEITESLTLSVGGTGAYMAAQYIALQQGYWEEEGLDVTLQVGAANVITQVVGELADIGIAGINTGLIPVAQGKETTIIFSTDVASSTAVFAATEGVDSPEDCTRITTGAAGTSAANWALVYTERLDLDAEIVNVSDPSTQLGTLLSGQTDCVIGTYSTFAKGIVDGDLHYLVDPTDEDTIPSEVEDLLAAPGVSGFVLKETFTEKADALLMYETGLLRALDFWMDSTDAEVAEVLATHPDWQAIGNADAIEGLLAVQRPYVTDGELPESAWEAALTMAKYAIPSVDADSDTWSYDARVDMSLWSAAQDAK